MVAVLPVIMLLFSLGLLLRMSQMERSCSPGVDRSHRSSRLHVISRGFAKEATYIPFFIFTNSLPAAAAFVHLSNTWRRRIGLSDWGSDTFLQNYTEDNTRPTKTCATGGSQVTLAQRGLVLFCFVLKRAAWPYTKQLIPWLNF